MGPMSWIRFAVVFAVLGSRAVSQRPPDEPFQAIHMIAATNAGDQKLGN